MLSRAVERCASPRPSDMTFGAFSFSWPWSSYLQHFKFPSLLIPMPPMPSSLSGLASRSLTGPFLPSFAQEAWAVRASPEIWLCNLQLQAPHNNPIRTLYVFYTYSIHLPSPPTHLLTQPTGWTHEKFVQLLSSSLSFRSCRPCSISFRNLPGCPQDH